MSTQKPLEKLIPAILTHIQEHIDYSEFNKRIYKVNEGQVKEEVEKSLAKELISISAYNRCIQRIPGVNILRKSVDKRSKVYTDTPVRHTDNSTDKELMDGVVKFSDLDKVLGESNRMLNAQHMTAVGPFLENKRIQFKVLGAHQFLPFSDDPVNPLNMTVFIQFMGQTVKKQGPVYDENGDVVQEDSVKLVDLFALYSDDEFMIIDSSGELRRDLMRERGFTSTENPFGKIPFVLITNTKLQLIPFPNQEGFDTAVLVPKLMADLNYAAQFMSHSVMWTKNTHLEGASINADAIVNLGDRNEEGGEPEIGVIDPKTDIDGVIKLINFQIKEYFSSIGIKLSSNVDVSDESGFSKAVDESDATNEVKKQVELYRNVESRLWEIVRLVYNFWASEGRLEDNRKFSEKFEDSISIEFAEKKPMKSDKQKLDEVEQLRNMKLMSRRQALRVVFPRMTEKQLDVWESELDEEEEKRMDQMLGAELGETLSDRGGDGQFTEGNQTGLKQNESVVDRGSDGKS